MSRKTIAEKFQGEEYDITVTGRNVLVTDAMKTYAIEKIAKIDCFAHRITEVNVIMDIQKLLHKVDFTLKIDHQMIKVSGSSENMYASIDKAVDRLQAKLRRYNQRIHEHQLRNLTAVEMNVQVVKAAAEENLEDINDQIETANNDQLLSAFEPHEVVSQETRPLSTLNRDEAMMKLELTDDLFLVYRNEATQKLEVAYRRKDSNFGIIELPEK